MKVKYSEIFGSLQGEAGHTGMPSVWLRLFGCNLECRGFGQEAPQCPSTWKDPFQNIDISSIKRMEDLPVIPYGCDSAYSWSEKLKHLAYTEDSSVIAEKLWEIAQEKFGCEQGWWHPKTNQETQLCFTGGEPMLWQRQMIAIMLELRGKGRAPGHITIETNGTKAMSMDFRQEFSNYHTHFSISPKLYSVSGEIDAVKYDVIKDYMENSTSYGWLKFVVNGSPESWRELEYHMNEINRFRPDDWTVWVMPVGATKEQQELPSVAEIANEAMRLGYNVSGRMHAYIYGNGMGT